MGTKPPRIVFDLETTSVLDLRRTGAAAYAEHPETRITVLCYAIGDGPVTPWLSSDPPPDFVRAIAAGAIVVAHNYLFEWNLYQHKLRQWDWPEIPLSQWSCTMARAYVAGYPGSLEMLGKVLGLGITKDTSARDLMLRMARPRTIEPEITWWHETAPDHWHRLMDYCAQDVAAEREADKHLPELSARERLLFEADHALNTLGMRVDVPLVQRLDELSDQAVRDIRDKLNRLTNGQITSPNQVDKLRRWFAGIGWDLPDLRRDTVQRWLADPSRNGPGREVLICRRDASRASTAKLDAILDAVSGDNRVRGCFQYYGASRTGRWAGRRLQPQNLFRGSISDVPAALDMIRFGATTLDLEQLFEDSAMGVVASCLRSTIQSAPGNKLVIMDYKQIEARVLAWLADDAATLEIFNTGQDIYSETARRVGLPNDRQLGKVLTLACGYGMGAARFQATAAAHGLSLALAVCDDLVHAWRDANQRIVDFWWNCARLLQRMTYAPPGAGQSLGKLTFIRQRRALLIRLPSTRHLVFRYPQMLPNPDNGHDEFTFMGSHGANWSRMRSWPGKVVGHITQAVARDVMAEAMIVLHHQEHVPLIATVHDELIAEVPEDQAEGVYRLMARVMSTSPGWAATLPLGAAGLVTARYQKG
jgi:DNA polymerase